MNSFTGIDASQFPGKNGGERIQAAIDAGAGAEDFRGSARGPGGFIEKEPEVMGQTFEVACGRGLHPLLL